MGREANTTKDRRCWTCREVFQVTARELKRHARLCREGYDLQKRAEASGIILPVRRNIVLPED